MKKQNPHRLGTGTSCEFYLEKDSSKPTNNTTKNQNKRSRYTGLTMSIFLAAKPTEVS